MSQGHWLLAVISAAGDFFENKIVRIKKWFWAPKTQCPRDIGFWGPKNQCPWDIGVWVQKTMSLGHCVFGIKPQCPWDIRFLGPQKYFIQSENPIFKNVCGAAHRQNPMSRGHWAPAHRQNSMSQGHWGLGPKKQCPWNIGFGPQKTMC